MSQLATGRMALVTIVVGSVISLGSVPSQIQKTHAWCTDRESNQTDDTGSSGERWRYTRASRSHLSAGREIWRQRRRASHSSGTSQRGWGDQSTDQIRQMTLPSKATPFWKIGLSQANVSSNLTSRYYQCYLALKSWKDSKIFQGPGIHQIKGQGGHSNQALFSQHHGFSLWGSTPGEIFSISDHRGNTSKQIRHHRRNSSIELQFVLPIHPGSSKVCSLVRTGVELKDCLKAGSPSGTAYRIRIKVDPKA